MPFVTEIYTGTGFDTSQSSTGTDADDHELTAISAASLVGKNYLKISVLGTSILAAGDVGDSSSTKLAIETKQTGGSYSTSMNFVTVANVTYRSTGAGGTNTTTWMHTLTAGEKTNGVQAKIFSETVVVSAVASYSNVQTTLILLQ